MTLNEHGFRGKRSVHDVLAMAKRKGIGNAAQYGELVINREFAAAVIVTFLFQKSIEGFSWKPLKNQCRPQWRSGIELLERQDIRMVPKLHEHVGFALHAAFDSLGECAVALGNEIRTHATKRAFPMRGGPMVLVIVAFLDQFGQVESSIEYCGRFVDLAQAKLGLREHSAQHLEHVAGHGTETQVFAGTGERCLTNGITDFLATDKKMRRCSIVLSELGILLRVSEPHQRLDAKLFHGVHEIGFAHAPSHVPQTTGERFGLGFEQRERMHEGFPSTFLGGQNEMPCIAFDNGALPRFQLDDIQALSGKSNGIDFVSPAVVSVEREEREATIRLVIGKGFTEPFETFTFVAMRRGTGYVEARRGHGFGVQDAMSSSTSVAPREVASAWACSRS